MLWSHICCTSVLRPPKYLGDWRKIVNCSSDFYNSRFNPFPPGIPMPWAQHTYPYWHPREINAGNYLSFQVSTCFFFLYNAKMSRMKYYIVILSQELRLRFAIPKACDVYGRMTLLVYLKSLIMALLYAYEWMYEIGVLIDAKNVVNNFFVCVHNRNLFILYCETGNSCGQIAWIEAARHWPGEKNC